MSYDIKKLSEVEALPEVPEGANMIAEVGGQIKRVPGSGLGGAMTWDDLGIGDVVETVLMEKQSIIFTIEDSIGMAAGTTNIEMIDGDVYVVSYDGTMYERTCKVIQNILYIGNAAFLGLPDTGEPFGYFTSDSERMWVSYDSNTEHTISVSKKTYEIFPVPNAYLPLASSDGPGAIKVYNVMNYKISKNYMKKIVQEFNDGYAMFLWSGRRVTEVYIDSSNEDLLIRFSDNPVCRQCIPAGSDSYTITVGSTYKGSQTNVVRLYVLDENDTSRYVMVSTNSSSDNASDVYLEIGSAYGTRIYVDGSIGLKSSESNKYFRISVNDSGTLTATEVTT